MTIDHAEVELAVTQADGIAHVSAQGETGAGSDVANVETAGVEFPYPAYLRNIVNQIGANFETTDPRPWSVDLAFRILRDGTVVDIEVRRSSGNRILPTQVVISESSVTHFRPQWIGKLEESIHISHVSSIRIDTNILFSDVTIETTGGHNPILCHGHSKGDAIEMKRLIEQFQSAFYRITQ